MDAGDSGAIPIKVGEGVDEAALRKAISVVWELSNWDVNKGICALRGAVLGDSIIKVVDDITRGEVRLELIHPATITELYLDRRGFVKAYEITEERVMDGRKVTFRETCERGENEDVNFKTYMGNKLYAWNGKAAEWTEVYGFIPLAAIQHNNVGLEWGWAESHPARSKIHDIDDLASKLHDHIRKMVDPVWLYNFKKPSTTPAMSTSTPTADRPEPGREEIPALYVDNENARAQALVASELDIEAVGMRIEKLMEEIERDYPELQEDIWSAGEDTSGRALREARKKVESKARDDRRPNYDKALVRCHQMAIAIGGYRGYDNFEGFDLGSYKAGKLDHRIGDRPVFRPDRLTELEEKKLFWETVNAGVQAGVPAEIVMQDLGWDDTKSREKLAAIQLKQEDRIPPTEQ